LVVIEREELSHFLSPTFFDNPDGPFANDNKKGAPLSWNL
jgi:hypothetical protein